MKKLSVILSLLSLPSPSAFAKDHVKKNVPYWSQGLVVASKTKTSIKGLFIPERQIKFNNGHYPSSEGKFLSVNYSASTSDDRVFQEVSSLASENEDRIALRYVKPLIHFGLFASSDTWITEVLKTKRFDHSSSFKEYGASCNIDHPKHIPSFGNHNASGKIIKVSRWGVFSNTCTAHVNLGGAKTINVKVSDGYSVAVGPGEVQWLSWSFFGGGNSLKLSPDFQLTERFHFETREVANIAKYNIYSDAACRFAEDIAISGETATFEVGVKYFDIWNQNRKFVKNMTVEKYQDLFEDSLTPDEIEDFHRAYKNQLEKGLSYSLRDYSVEEMEKIKASRKQLDI